MRLNLLLLLIQQMEQTLAMAKNNNNNKNNNIKYVQKKNTTKSNRVIIEPNDNFNTKYSTTKKLANFQRVRENLDQCDRCTYKYRIFYFI